MAVPFWTRGDLNAFFGLGINMLVNVLVLAGLCIGVVNMAPDDVYRVVLPALGIELLIGNIFYFYLARRLAMKERRTDVTAMPYGPSVPHMFIVTLVIMLPTYLATKDPVAAWMAGLAWAFIIGVIILIGAFVGPTIRHLTPRAAMLGTLAGISLAFISMRPARADVGRAVDRAAGLHDHHRRLHRRACGCRATSRSAWRRCWSARRSAGSAATWSPPRSATPPKAIAIGIPSLNIDLLIDGLEGISPLLATAIPLGIYNFTEAMSNVESRRGGGRQLQPAPRAAGRRHRRRRRRRARLAVPARRLHRPPGLEGRRRPHLLLAGVRRRDLPAVRVRVVPAARRRCCRSRRSCRCCCSSAS